MWDKVIQPWNVVNAGIGSDSTQHVLWRLKNGLLQHCNPKVYIFLLCGKKWSLFFIKEIYTV